MAIRLCWASASPPSHEHRHWWRGRQVVKLTPIAYMLGNPVPRPVTSDTVSAEPVVFTAEEARRGYAMRGNTKHYCCYGMYCDAGHTSDCAYGVQERHPCRWFNGKCI